MPLHRNFTRTTTSLIGLWKIKESYEELYNLCKKSGFTILELEKFKSELKRKQWLAARCLTRAMDANLKEIYYQKNGAPFTREGIFISLTHSYEMVGVVLDSVADVGIDIQQFSSKILAIKHKFCSEQELSFLETNVMFEQLHIIWAVKEAIYKKLKISGLIFRDQILIQPFELSKVGIIKASVSLPNNVISFHLHYEIIDDYILAYTLNP